MRKLTILGDESVPENQKQELLRSLTDDQLLNMAKILNKNVEQANAETLLRRGRIYARRKQREEEEKRCREEEETELRETEKFH